MKNNILHTKGIMNSYSQQYIDHNLFKQTLLNDDKPQKISFNTISVKNQQISTNKITKSNIEFLNDKRYIENKHLRKQTFYFALYLQTIEFIQNEKKKKRNTGWMKMFGD